MCTVNIYYVYINTHGFIYLREILVYILNIFIPNMNCMNIHVFKNVYYIYIYTVHTYIM